MAEVELQAYLNEAKELIDTGSHDEAIAICRHILKQYPKYVEAYRVLAEATLEKGEHEEALDLFRRVLSADPESFVAYIGIGIIYEEDDLLDEAIWQFERAFELAPANAEIRRELKRLYTQRDGVEPARLKLNRAALGRLYARGGFYAQAIAELRGILEADPDRIDIELALAETFWRDGRQREAAEICQDVLNKLPNCLKADLLLGEIWLKSGQEEEGNTLLRRAESLDPENRVAQALFGDSSPLPARTIKIKRLEASEMAEMVEHMPQPQARDVPTEEREEWERLLKAVTEEAPAEEAAALPEEATSAEPLWAEETVAGAEEAPQPLAGEPELISAEAEEEEEEEESPAIAALEAEFGALPELDLTAISEEERERLLASMPPEGATPEEVLAWLQAQQRAEQLPEEVAAEAPPVVPEPEITETGMEEESPTIAALEEEFGALPEVGLEQLSAEERAAILASMPPETATPDEIMAWLRQRQAGLAAVEAAAEVGEEMPAPAEPEVEAEAPAPVAPEQIAAEVAAEVAEEVAPEVEAEAEVATPVAPEQVAAEVAAEVVEEVPAPMQLEVEAEAEVATPVAPEQVAAEVAAEVVKEVAPPAEPQVEAEAEVAMPVVPEAVAAEPVEETAMEAAPGDAGARLALARAYAAEAAWAEAAAQYAELVQSSPDVLAEVVADLERYTAAQPQQLALQQVLGDAYMEAGRLDEALAKYNWLLKQV